MWEITCSHHRLLQASNARKMIGERKASQSDAVDIPIWRTSLYQPLFSITATQSIQHKTTGKASTAKNSYQLSRHNTKHRTSCRSKGFHTGRWRHRLGGSREKSAKNMEPVLHDQRPFTKLWSQKLYKIFYSVIRYLYSKTCLKRNAIVPVFFSVFIGFRFTKGCVLIKQSTKNMIA